MVGNPELTAEVGYNADVGITYFYAGSDILNLLRVDAAWFGSWVDDLIAYIQNSQSTSRPENIAAARILGAELARDDPATLALIAGCFLGMGTLRVAFLRRRPETGADPAA